MPKDQKTLRQKLLTPIQRRPKCNTQPEGRPGTSTEPTVSNESFVPYSGSADWMGFKRSSQSVSRHYKAKCNYCESVVDGRPILLRKHKAECTEIPAEMRPPPPSETTQPKISRNQSIAQMFAEGERSQEDSDYLLGMAVITGDIPYRFLQNPFLVAYQQKYEVKGRQRLSEYR